jgi:RNA polymerase sigma-70 factor (ECF subfamily)
LIPRELAPRLHDLLRRHFRAFESVEVVVERRQAERRGGSRRRTGGSSAVQGERRLIGDVAGRRTGERRATAITVPPPELPRRARPFAESLVFIERLEPSSDEVEDIHTARLVKRIQAGDRSGFSELYLRYFDRVYGYLRLMVRDRHEAEDLAQTVFIRAMEALPTYQRRRQPFRAWLFVIARNTALDHLAKHHRVELTEPEQLDRRREAVAELGGIEPLEWITDRELLMFIEHLPLLQRQVLVARYMLELRTTEAAEVLGTSPDAVRSAQKRAMHALRIRFSAVGTAPKSARRSYVREGLRQSAVLRGRRFALRRY